MNLILYTDGGARGNPGPAGIGVVVKNSYGKTVYALGKYIGSKTNNEAEYMALIAGLSICLNTGAKKLSCFLDSELVVRQMLGQYRVKEKHLKTLWQEAKTIEKKFSTVSYQHVLRSQNKQADALVNQALDAQSDVG